MTRFLRLLELLRIAEKHEVLRGLSAREHVCEGHLPRLVDEEDVDRSSEAFFRPDPRRPANNVVLPIQDLRDSLPGVRLLIDPRTWLRRLVAHSVHAAHAN